MERLLRSLLCRYLEHEQIKIQFIPLTFREMDSVYLAKNSAITMVNFFYF